MGIEKFAVPIERIFPGNRDGKWHRQLWKVDSSLFFVSTFPDELFHLFPSIHDIPIGDNIARTVRTLGKIIVVSVRVEGNGPVDEVY